MNESELHSLSVDELESLVRHHNQLYWDAHQPEISDYEYDRIIRRLREVAPASPMLESMGPTKSGSGDLGEKVRHAHRMLSLDKCYNEQELLHWAESFEGDAVASPKFDGVACSILYDSNGDLSLAATRGDGEVGENITVNVREIRDIPKRINASNIEVRGELFMRLSVFKEFKEQGFLNPRNLTAGAIKLKDSAESKAYQLSFAAYDILGSDQATEAGKMDLLATLGFPAIERAVVSREQLQTQYESLAKRRESLDFEIDGVVYRANSIAEQRRLGSTAHHPRYAIAYKFQGDSGTTILRDVEWSVARSGAITPVGIIDPVLLSGAMVSRASLHHPGFIQKLGLTKNATVVVMRRGGVIPNVEFVSAAGDAPIEIPTRCPSCGGPVRAEKDFLYCADVAHCAAAVIGQLAHFAGAVGMVGFGEAVLTGGYTKGFLRRPQDFYSLTLDKLLTLDRMGTKVANKLLAELERGRTMDLATFLRAFGLPELGKHVSAVLADRFETLDRVFAVTAEELAAVHSIGEVIARSVVRGLAEARDEIEAVRAQVTISQPAHQEMSTSGPFAGQSYVFTGKMATLDRKAAELRVRKLGGTVSDSVTKTLTYLVVGDKKATDKSTKEKAAEKLILQGATLTVMRESDFLIRVDEAEKNAVAGEENANTQRALF